MPKRTRSLACKSKKAHELVTTGSPETPGLPCAMVLTVSFVLPGDRALLSPSQAMMRKHHRRLDISVGMSGPHDFAVRIGGARLAPQPASTASRTQRS
jgi:hypothetical protein